MSSLLALDKEFAYCRVKRRAHGAGLDTGRKARGRGAAAAPAEDATGGLGVGHAGIARRT
eukprot:scaffold65937_cov67-Phaeocystis_antarctica.AAC.1